MNAKILDVSCGQTTPAGQIVGNLFYDGVLEKLLKREEYSGYPHNGGQHSLTLRLKLVDLNAFLVLAGEHYAKKGPQWTERFDAFVRIVKKQWSDR